VRSNRVEMGKKAWEDDLKQQLKKKNEGKEIAKKKASKPRWVPHATKNFVEHNKVTFPELYELFEAFGLIKSMQYPPKNGRRGLAFVHFEHASSGAKAIETLNGHKLYGRALRIEVSKTGHKSQWRDEGIDGTQLKVSFKPKVAASIPCSPAFPTIVPRKDAEEPDAESEPDVTRASPPPDPERRTGTPSSTSTRPPLPLGRPPSSQPNSRPTSRPSTPGSTGSRMRWSEMASSSEGSVRSTGPDSPLMHTCMPEALPALDQEPIDRLEFFGDVVVED